MQLDGAACYRAILARDRRFDGRFFTGIRTTGIYCRPICPARPAKRENMRFFPCAAAAEEAGFRPCKRCRPETAPGTPAWVGSPAVVARALQLINDGALDDDGDVDTLAERLGIGARQLRRLFTSHLGASPAAVARARRVHFARRLLDETHLSMAEIAFSSGFGSIRAFNWAIRTTFGSTPSELRRGPLYRSRPIKALDDADLVVRLPFRPPFDWGTLIGFLAARAVPGVEWVEDDTYRRTIAVDGSAGAIAVRRHPEEHSLTLSLRLPTYRHLIAVVQRVRRLFDLDADPVVIADHLQEDALLRPLVTGRPGLRVPGSVDRFELAVRAIVGQQISVRGARTLLGRIVSAYGKPVAGLEDLGLTHLFPTADDLADVDSSGLGLTRARAETLRAIARAGPDGELDGIPGVGDWTVQYVAMRADGEPDAFPAADLGLRRAAGNGKPLSTASMTARAERWRPWRAYAAMHLWTSGGSPSEATDS